MCDNKKCECNTSDNSSDKDGRDGKYSKNSCRCHKSDKCDKCDTTEIISRHTSKCKCNSHCDREHNCNCKKYVVDFSRLCNIDDIKIINIVSNTIIVVNGYTFNTDSNQECSMIKHSLKLHKYGLVCSNTHTLQIDLGDFIRVKSMKCLDPKIKIGRIDKYEKVIVWGSNIAGSLGKEIYSYINNSCDQEIEITIPSFDTTNLTKTGDIYIYGSLPFRYISITSCNCSITLNSLSIYLPA